MIKFNVRVIGVDPATSREMVLASLESHRFDPVHAEDQVRMALEAAQRSVAKKSAAKIEDWKAEISIYLSVEGEPLRPALHLEAQTLRQLAAAGASLDFDPYV